MYLQRWHGWCHKNLLPSRRVLCTPCNHAPCHFMQSHIRKVYACLAVTCHLRFWQNDRGLLFATAVTRGWNGYRNKSQHRKLTPEKKIVPPLLQGFEPATFRSRAWRSNHWDRISRNSAEQKSPNRAEIIHLSALPFVHYRKVLFTACFAALCTAVIKPQFVFCT